MTLGASISLEDLERDPYPIYERLELPCDAFLVEWDDLGRDGAIMVMGILSSKVRELEDEDDLLRQMNEAASIIGGMERLAISSQCGFASVMVGNEIDEGSQWRKLELVGRLADRLWGTA